MRDKKKSGPLATIGAIILFIFYSAALFANFLAPYSAEQEFREFFYHPPSAVHFFDRNGQLVWPYVTQSQMADSRKHLYREGSPISVAVTARDQNKNPYIAESIDEEIPFAVIRTLQGRTVGTVPVGRETEEDSGIFHGQTVIDAHQLGNEFVVESRGRRKRFSWRDGQYVSTDPGLDIFLRGSTGKPETRYVPVKENYPLKFWVDGEHYKLFGLFPSKRHLFGVDAPGQLFLLGTDQAGRDVFSRALLGSRVSLTVALIGVAVSTIVGLWIGGIAGYVGGKIDSLLMRSADVLMCIPALYLILSVRNTFPTNIRSEASYALMVVVLGLTGWASMARVIRGMVLALREESYVLAARTSGASTIRILTRHILPNTFGYVIARATLLVPAYILAEVTLSYLGIGIQEPAASWGNMLSAAQEIRVLEDFPWILAPGGFLFLAVLGFNFVGEGLTHKTRRMRSV